MKSNPKPYEYDFDGSCGPKNHDIGKRWNITFSVGVFQWIPKSRGKGLKRGKVIKRISGLVAKPDDVYSRAEKICKEKNEELEGRE
jgi:hypothetical protein